MYDPTETAMVNPHLDWNTPEATNTNDFIELMRDGVAGYDTAADAVEHEDLGAKLRAFGNTRRSTVQQAVRAAVTDGMEAPEEDGSGAGALHRTWMGLKGALAGDESVIKTAINAEEYAESEIERLLDAGLTPSVVPVAQSALEQVRTCLDELRTWVTN